jgi:hypothetical protein
MPRLSAKSTQFTAPAALWLCTSATWAHDGHSQQGSHWHATDLWGFVAIGVVLAVAVWHGRK